MRVCECVTEGGGACENSVRAGAGAGIGPTLEGAPGVSPGWCGGQHSDGFLPVSWICPTLGRTPTF